MFAIDAARRVAAVAVTAVQSSKRILSGTFFLGLLAGGVTTTQIHKWWTSSLNVCLSSAAGLDQISNTQSGPVLAFTLYPVTAPAGQIAVLAVAVGVLISFLLWAKRAASTSFFLGVLAGIGFVLSFDIVWVHWIFGLHHLTNTQMDLVLEPLLVLLGLAFLWFSIGQERRQANGAAP